MKIGKNIKKIMDEKNIDFEFLKDSMGYDESTLNKILNDEQAPSASELLKISALLDTEISILLYGRINKSQKCVKTSWDERVRVDRKGKLNYESLAPNYPNKVIEPFIVEIFRDDEAELSQHAGEEFHYVIKGTAKITVDNKDYILEPGDSLYFDSSLPHSLNSITERTQVLSAIYYKESLVHHTKGFGMKAIIESARMLKNKKIALVCPDSTSISAVNHAIDEKIIESAYLIGNLDKIKELCGEDLKYTTKYTFIEVEINDQYEINSAKKAVELIKNKQADMLMKGKINTANFVKAVLDKKEGISSGRRLSLVSIFEIPDVNRLIMLTDPGINPELFAENDVDTAIDIVKNAIDVAKSLGVNRPKVALLDANEVPSSKIPTTIHEKTLSEMEWESADVYGPLSYDLALYEEAVKKKGITNNKVAGKADILVVPHISGGNFLYKTWVMTLGAEVANIVLGAKAPIILTSRSDSDITKFLTICASSIYGSYLEKKGAIK
jgi:phosphate butyryltransferase